MNCQSGDARRSSWVPVILCLAGLTVGFAAAYAVGARQFREPARYAATAAVRWISPEQPSLDAINSEVKRLAFQADSEHGLREVLAASTRGRQPDSGSLNAIRRSLHLRVGQRPGGSPEIAISATAENQAFAMEVVDCLARRYAGEKESLWQAAAQRRYEMAADALTHARSELDEATRRRDSWVEQQRQREPPAPPAPALTPPTPSTPPISDPRRAELSEQIRALTAERDELLVGRQPSHPAVKYVDQRIAELREQLAAMPAPRDGPMLKPPVDELRRIPPPVDKDSSELRQLERAVADARRKCEQAAAAEREASNQLREGAGICVIPAQCRTIKSPGPPRQLAWIALVVGILVSGTIGATSYGINRDRPLRTVDEVRCSLPLSIVGVIPKDE
jgi:hypothetical protein